MSESSYSLMLHNLSNDYYQNIIGFEEYRNQRKIILDKIDVEFNGVKSFADLPEQDDESSIFMQTIAFHNNAEVDNKD